MPKKFYVASRLGRKRTRLSWPKSHAKSKRGEVEYYVLNEEEEAAIREALAQLDRGEGVSEEEMEAFWKRCGIK